MNGGVVLIFGAAVALTIALVMYGRWKEKQRREAFQVLAGQLGLKYRERDPSIAARYKFLDKLHQGNNRYAFNILDGTFEGHDVLVFDFHYETYSTDSKGRRQTHHHYFSFFILEQEREFPELRIYPENLFSRIGQALGFDDIDFESIEFSKAFTVRGPDKRFAYDICHAGMMEYLLEHPDLALEIEGRCVSLGMSRRLETAEIEGRLRQLCQVRALFPEYLYRN